MAELISFVVPTQSDKVLLVWELSAGPPAEALRHSLSAAFSQFGLLYSVRVFPNAAVARPGFYAIIKFYSSRDAQRAQRACDGKPLFQTSPVKVRLSTRHKALRHQAFALNSSRCQELANFYFGFNGWSKRILKLQELPGAEDKALAGPGRKQSLKFFCAVEVVLPSYGCRSPGVGIADEPLHQLEEAPIQVFEICLLLLGSRTAIVSHEEEDRSEARDPERLVRRLPEAGHRGFRKWQGRGRVHSQ
nr:RAD52 motif-containing protein 1 isoform X3 [Peromyscus maniculatus bairdii]